MCSFIVHKCYVNKFYMYKDNAIFHNTWNYVIKKCSFTFDSFYILCKKGLRSVSMQRVSVLGGKSIVCKKTCCGTKKSGFESLESKEVFLTDSGE